MSIRLASLALILAGLPFAAHAADDAAIYGQGPAVEVLPAPEESVDLVIELGAGGRVAPSFEGSDDYLVSPFPIISVEYLNIPGVFTTGGGPRGGLSFGPSFGYSGERSEEEFDGLTGLDPVDATYELGLRVGYETLYSSTLSSDVYGAVRYAFGGADGFVGEVGADLIYQPTPVLELKAGPLATFASNDYMDSYFSVSPEESVRSGLRFAPHDADGGFESVGGQVGARYEFRPDLFLTADAEYRRLVGDAADSPIVDLGDENQYSFSLGLSKRFSLDLF